MPNPTSDKVSVYSSHRLRKVELFGSDGKPVLHGSSRGILRSIDDQVIIWGRMIKSLRITKAFVFFTDRNRDRFIFSGAHQNGTSHYFVSIVRTTSMFCMI